MDTFAITRVSRHNKNVTMTVTIEIWRDVTVNSHHIDIGMTKSSPKTTRWLQILRDLKFNNVSLK